MRQTINSKNKRSSVNRTSSGGRSWRYLIFLFSLISLLGSTLTSSRKNEAAGSGNADDTWLSLFSLLPVLNLLNFPVAAAAPQTLEGMRIDPAVGFGKDKYDTKQKVLDRIQERIKFDAGFNHTEKKRIRHLIGEATQQWLNLEDEYNNWGWCTLSIFAYDDPPLHVLNRRATQAELSSRKKQMLINGRRLILESDYGGNVLALFAFSFMPMRVKVLELPVNVEYVHPTRQNCSLLKVTEKDMQTLPRVEEIISDRLQALYAHSLSANDAETIPDDLHAFNNFRPYFIDFPSEQGEQLGHRITPYKESDESGLSFLSLAVRQELPEYSLYFPLELDYLNASQSLGPALGMRAFYTLTAFEISNYYSGDRWKERLVYLETLGSILSADLRNSTAFSELRQFSPDVKAPPKIENTVLDQWIQNIRVLSELTAVLTYLFHPSVAYKRVALMYVFFVAPYFRFGPFLGIPGLLSEAEVVSLTYEYLKEILFPSSEKAQTLWGIITGGAFGFRRLNDWRHPWWLMKVGAMVHSLVSFLSYRRNRLNYPGMFLFLMTAMLVRAMARFASLNSTFKQEEMKQALLASATPPQPEPADSKEQKKVEPPPPPAQPEALQEAKSTPRLEPPKPINADIEQLLQYMATAMEVWRSANKRLNSLAELDSGTANRFKFQLRELISYDLIVHLINLISQLASVAPPNFPKLQFDNSKLNTWESSYQQLYDWLQNDRKIKNEIGEDPLAPPKSFEKRLLNFSQGLVKLRNKEKGIAGEEVRLRRVQSEAKKTGGIRSKIEERREAKAASSQQEAQAEPQEQEAVTVPPARAPRPLRNVDRSAGHPSSRRGNNSSSSSDSGGRYGRGQTSAPSSSASDQPDNESKQRRPRPLVLSHYVNAALLSQSLQKLQADLKELQENLKKILDVEVKGNEESVKINAIALMLVWINELFPRLPRHPSAEVAAPLNNLMSTMGSLRHGFAKIHHHLLAEDKNTAGLCHAMCQLGNIYGRILNEAQATSPVPENLKKYLDEISENEVYVKWVRLSTCDTYDDPQKLEVAHERAADHFYRVFVEKPHIHDADREYMWQASSVFSIVVWNPLKKNMIRAGMRSAEIFNSVLGEIGQLYSNEARHEWQTSVQGFVAKINDKLKSADICSAPAK